MSVIKKAYTWMKAVAGSRESINASRVSIVLNLNFTIPISTPEKEKIRLIQNLYSIRYFMVKTQETMRAIITNEATVKICSGK